MGECDRCGLWHSLDAMSRQFQWAGNSLVDTGLLVGSDCLDVPQDQYRSLILPPDPVPRENPRPSANVTAWPIIGQPLPTSPENLGFTQFVLGASQPGLYPTTKAAVLAQAATASGIPTPVTTDDSIRVATVNASIALMAANPARSWLLLYNPAVPQAQLALGATAAWGTLGNLVLGPGEAFFWATAQGLGTVYQGALALIGLSPGVPFFAWQA